jgi:hypothetical protein
MYGSVQIHEWAGTHARVHCRDEVINRDALSLIGAAQLGILAATSIVLWEGAL